MTSHFLRLPFFLGSILALLLVTGCGPRIMVEQSPDAGLPGAGTYAWGTATDHISGDQNPRVNNDIIAGKLQTAVDNALQKRGYREVPAAEAAWLVHYHVGVERHTVIVTEPLLPPPPHIVCGTFRCATIYDWGFYGPPEYMTHVVTYHEGTLLIDIHDARRNKLVWRGMLTDEVDVSRPLDVVALQKAVDKLMVRLPVVPKEKSTEK